MARYIHSKTLKERLIVEKEYGDRRNPYQRDRDRIIFSRSLRRLGFKTQVVTASGRITSDHIRSRLTHSLEVMQIASSIASEVNEREEKQLNEYLIQAIALGHDLGHTPYGHVGEEALFEFVFGCEDHCFKEMLKNKLRHSFQSLKLCCFLEKQYRPDFYGLNLTVATLDGIFKHSKLSREEAEFYKMVFESYCDVFLEDIKVNYDIKECLIEILFNYESPVTYEGIIVAVADEIAQLCHDIEDIRRLGGFEAVESYYRSVQEILRELISRLKPREIIEEIYEDFDESLNKISKNMLQITNEITKIERLYVKLILSIAIPTVAEAISNLMEMDVSERESLLKNKYLGDFKGLKIKELELEEDDREVLEKLKTLLKKYQETMMNLPDVIRWDIKGREICEELSKMLQKAIERERAQYGSISFRILPKETRKDLEKSYRAGEIFRERFISTRGSSNNKELEDIPVKFAVWDYVAGMTDSYIIREYESLTFKKVELK